MIAVVALALLSAAPTDAPQQPPAPPPDNGNVVWLQPIGSVVLPLFGALEAGRASEAAVFFSLGGTFSFKPFDIVAELGWARVPQWNSLTSTEIQALFGLWVASGIAIHSGDKDLSGVFLELRLQLGVVYPERSIYRLDIVFDVQVGLNFGYQLVLGKHLYLAMILGGSFGAGSNQTNTISGPLFPGVGAPQTWRTVIGVNANLVRIGFAF